MATRRKPPPPPPDDDDAERSKGVRKETEAEQYLRRVDEHLQSATVNLRRVRDISSARDALKLVRQAHNLVMDAQDDAT